MSAMRFAVSPCLGSGRSVRLSHDETRTAHKQITNTFGNFILVKAPRLNRICQRTALLCHILRRSAGSCLMKDAKTSASGAT